MRRAEKQLDEVLAWRLLARASHVHLAGTTAAGEPVIRALHHVVHDGALWFHSAPKGEKLELVGRPVVASVVEDLGRVPSYATHPERACPATTWFRSAQVHGVLEEEHDPIRKAAALQALMERLQPEGGYRPITADERMYRGAVRGLAVLRLRGRIVGKHSLGQHKPLADRERIATALWHRGEPGDAALIAAMLAASPEPLDLPFLRGPAGVRLRCHLDEADVDGAVALLRGTYWSTERTDAEIAATQLSSPAWVGAEDAHGLCGTARAVSDGIRYAWIGDVCVREDRRREGIGRALMNLLLAHPAVRKVRRVVLATRTPEVYVGHGFVEAKGAPGRVEMERVR